MSRLKIQSSIDVKTILTANISNNFKTAKENEENLSQRYHKYIRNEPKHDTTTIPAAPTAA